MITNTPWRQIRAARAFERRGETLQERGLTGGMTSVGGVVVAVALLAVAVAAVFGADDVGFLKGRAGRGVE